MNYTDIDWNKAWATETELWNQSAGKPCQGFWEDKQSAEVFAKKDIEQHRDRLEKTLAHLTITPETKVLDIGAGPGNLAIPMAKKAAWVTALEPSPGMNEVMADQIAEHCVTNITQIRAAWEDVPMEDLVPPYNLVVASLCLGMPDLAGAIEKMNQVCCGEVALFWHAGIPEWENMPRALWPDILGRPYHGGPKSDIIFQLLYQMGIYPQVSVFSNSFCEIFDSMETAVGFYARRFQILAPEHAPIVEAYLDQHCKRDERGLVHQFTHHIMKLSWQPVERSVTSTRGDKP